MASTAWTWKDSPGKLICLVQGEPRPTVEWYEAPDANGNRSPITEGRLFTISNKEMDANTIMSTLNVCMRQRSNYRKVDCFILIFHLFHCLNTFQ